MVRGLAVLLLTAVAVAQAPQSRPSLPASAPSDPRPEAVASIFVKSLAVRLPQTLQGGVVRHTVDGSEPAPTSAPAPEVLTLTETTTVRTRAFVGERAVTGVASATFTKVVPKPGLDVTNLEPGLRCCSTSGEFTRIPTIAPQDEDAWRPCARIELLGPLKEDHVAARFVGFLRIDEPEVYEFELTSKDGSRLSLSGKTVLDNDGVHEARSVRTQVALGEGMHLLQVEWFHTTGTPVLELAFAKAGQKLEPVPVTSLCRGKRE